MRIDGGGGANVVQGNYIGTDVDSLPSLGNDNGITVTDAPNNLIGGASAGARNYILANNSVVHVTNPGSAGTVIQGNVILDNDNGIVLFATTGITVGGFNSGNVIGSNTFRGVLVGGTSSANSIFANSIFNNDALGIDLHADNENANTVTPNDVLDNDTGPNELQNYPVINSIAVSGNERTVEGELSSNPNTDYVLHFYSNSEVDPSGFGEGQFYLGALNKHSDAQGHLNFGFPLNAAAGGKFITATATDASGNTSEFSKASAAVPAHVFEYFDSRIGSDW